MRETILVSACLLGLNTRYNGERRVHPEVEAFLDSRRLLPIPVCPEQLGGLPTPRPSAAFSRGDGEALLAGSGELQDEHGKRLNEVFLRGAEETLRVALLTGCSRALLKERSPSCGCRSVHRNGTLVSGIGVTAALLQRHAIMIMSEEDI